MGIRIMPWSEWVDCAYPIYQRIRSEPAGGMLYGFYFYVKTASSRCQEGLRLVSDIHLRSEEDVQLTFIWSPYSKGIGGTCRIYFSTVSDVVPCCPDHVFLFLYSFPLRGPVLMGRPVPWRLTKPVVFELSILDALQGVEMGEQAKKIVGGLSVTSHAHIITCW